MVEDHMTEYTVEHGHSLDLSWEVPGAPLEGPPANVHESFALVEFPDGTSKRVTGATGFIFTRDTEAKKIMVNLNWSDTSELPLGTATYRVFVVSTSGDTLLDESGTIEITPQVSEPTERVVRPWDLLNPWEARATDEVRELRLATCGECDHLKHGVCEICHCVMKLKTTLARASCPIGKW